MEEQRTNRETVVGNVINVTNALIYPDVSLEGPSEILVDLVKDTLLEEIPYLSCALDPYITCSGLR